MAQAAYRFLPWARRGLSTMVTAPDTGQDLPQRPSLAAGLTVSGAGSHGVDLSLYGPAASDGRCGIPPIANPIISPRSNSTFPSFPGSSRPPQPTRRSIFVPGSCSSR
jgi:hypothetical protein